MSLMSRIAKKIRRRFRKKGTRSWDPSATMTNAEKLIMNNWGIRFDFTPALGNGRRLAAERLKAKQKANKKIPSIERPPSRQVVRHQLRRMKRMASHQENIGHTQKRGVRA